MLSEERDCQGMGCISMSALEKDFTAQYSTALTDFIEGQEHPVIAIDVLSVIFFLFLYYVGFYL